MKKLNAVLAPWALAFAAAYGCTVVAEVDRSKIPNGDPNSAGSAGSANAGTAGGNSGGSSQGGNAGDGSGATAGEGAGGSAGEGAGGSAGEGGGGATSGGGGEGGDGVAGETGSAGEPGAGGDGSGGPACDTSDHDGCSAAQLCCDGGSGAACVAVSTTGCSACDVGCDLTKADSCVDRVCQCGNDPACSGGTPFCVGGECVECQLDGDCTGNQNGEECVDNVCRACDPADHSGCSGGAPICGGAFECEACTASGECPGDLNCNNSTGACDGCVVGGDDCTNPTSPICVEVSAGVTECQACENDGECAGLGVNLGQCVGGTGKCEFCDPTNDDGCTAQRCAESQTGGYECVDCVADSDCSGTTPLCDEGSNTCVACNDPAIADGDADCGADEGGVCVTSGAHQGECGVCDPADHQGCSDGAQCNSDTLLCE